MTDDRPDVRLEALVRGIVQGVFFRYHAKLRADSLGLVGTVENLPDGTVRVIAEGSRESLDALASWLHVGPPSARVDRVDVSWEPAERVFAAFRILR
jgi:acylphosphatase